MKSLSGGDHYLLMVTLSLVPALRMTACTWPSCIAVYHWPPLREIWSLANWQTGSRWSFFSRFAPIGCLLPRTDIESLGFLIGFGWQSRLTFE